MLMLDHVTCEQYILCQGAKSSHRLRASLIKDQPCLTLKCVMKSLSSRPLPAGLMLSSTRLCLQLSIKFREILHPRTVQPTCAIHAVPDSPAQPCLHRRTPRSRQWLHPHHWPRQLLLGVLSAHGQLVPEQHHTVGQHDACLVAKRKHCWACIMLVVAQLVHKLRALVQRWPRQHCLETAGVLAWIFAGTYPKVDSVVLHECQESLCF